jgi:hypothetical protein
MLATAPFPVPAAPLEADVLISLADLWLPILLSTVAIFFLSMLAWTVAPHHKHEMRKLPNETDVLDAVRRLGVAPGAYFFPYCEGKDMKTEEGKQRYMAGPWGRLQLYPKTPSMGASMLGSALLYFVASVCLGYIGAATLPRGTEFLRVFQVVGVAGVLTYTIAIVPQIIWFGRSWASFVAHVVDGLVYGFATAALFAWLWP